MYIIYIYICIYIYIYVCAHTCIDVCIYIYVCVVQVSNLNNHKRVLGKLLLKWCLWETCSTINLGGYMSIIFGLFMLLFQLLAMGPSKLNCYHESTMLRPCLSFTIFYAMFISCLYHFYSMFDPWPAPPSGSLVRWRARQLGPGLVLGVQCSTAGLGLKLVAIELVRLQELTHTGRGLFSVNGPGLLVMGLLVNPCSSMGPL